MALLPILLALSGLIEAREPIPYKVEAKLSDVAVPAIQARVHVDGYIGKRIDANVGRLKGVDLEPLLAGFRHKPGTHPWIGEHIGKWMHAATLAWSNSGDAQLKKKLDYAAQELIKSQEPDGYLGTYTPDKRFGLFPEADWDVWSHKYCLLGLLTYYHYTGDPEALKACERAGDLLISTFGPGKKSILSAGTHVGMAATSVLEPIVLLYRSTGEAKYLDFARYIVSSWNEPGGPRILDALLNGKGVGQIANGKAYEMLSNIMGLCELARATGESTYLTAAKNAWADVVKNQLYITGAASYFEHFHADHDLPSGQDFNVGETCVTVTWMQLCEQLLRLTGEAKYGDEFERSLYNHLAAAQRPDGKEWCYYTSLDGTKPYTHETCCCLSSGPRGMVLVPEIALMAVHRDGDDYLAVNLLDPINGNIEIAGANVEVASTSEFSKGPFGTVVLTLDKPAKFGLMLRAPEWARPMTGTGASVKNGWLTIPPKTWKSGEIVDVSFLPMTRLVLGGPSNKDQAALTWGPFVLAYDQARNPSLGSPLKYGLSNSARAAVSSYSRNGSSMSLFAGVESANRSRDALFVPFADAGASGGRYRIWLRAPGKPNPFADSAFLDARESRSAQGNVGGSTTDGEPGTYVVTFDGKLQKEAWFSVSVAHPVELRRVVFVHGRSFHDGGWFVGKPRLEAKVGGTWVLLGELDGYPATTATDAKGLKGGEAFTLSLPKPVKATSIRVVGIPASGDNPAQSFASCAELQGYSK